MLVGNKKDGNKIDIVISSKILAIRDASDSDDGIYDCFGINVSNNCDENCDDPANGEKERKKRYENNDVIYGET